MNYLKNFYQAHKAKIKIAVVGLLVAVADALIALADSGGQHVSVAGAVAAGAAAAYLYLKKVYHAERANLATQALVEATTQAPTPADAEAK